MADQNRWNQDRERGARYGSDDRSKRGYEDYARRDYGSDDWRSGSGYGREDRSFGAEDEFSAGSGWRDRSDYDYGESRYGGGQQRQQNYGSQRERGEGDYGGRGRGAYGAQRGYGGQPWEQGPWELGQERYGGSQQSKGGYGGSQQYGQGGNYGGSQQYGQGGYGIGAERETQRYGSSQDYASSRGYGQGGQGWRGQDRDQGEHRTWMEKAGEKIGRFFGGEEQERSHRGRGPKNYTRSDDRIREDVNDRLADDHWLDASDVEVQVSSCEVTLTGTVNSRDDKRRAEDIAEQVSGVRHVQNNLRVQSQTSSFDYQTGSSTGSTATGSTTASTTGASAPIPGAATDGNGASGRTRST